jgi:tetratricopeptide (TPR) repeat protein
MRRSRLAVLALATTAAGMGGFVAAGRSQADEPLSAQFRPRCLLEGQSLELDPWSLDPSSGLLEHHAWAHGWSRVPVREDLVPRSSGARCPEWFLDRVLEREPYFGLPGLPGGIRLELAELLARNDRTDDALQLLDRWLDRSRVDAADVDRSSASACAARIAAAAGHWQRALDYAEEWSTKSGCGNDEGSKERRKQLVRARCLKALGRYDELAQACLSTLTELKRSLALIELWIDSEIETGRARDGEEALTYILEQVPENWHFFCKEALGMWKLHRAPREEQIGRLRDLILNDPEHATPLVLSLTRDELRTLLEVLEPAGDASCCAPGPAHATARALAELGVPNVGSAIERARKACPEASLSTLNALEETWKAAHVRWKVLSGASP